MVSWDAQQAYLEFYRLALHVMRQLKKEGKLNDSELLFFEEEKPLEELYNLKSDPEKLHNLANNPKHRKKLEELRLLTLDYDKKTKLVSDTFEPVHAGAVDLLEWVKTEKPDLYDDMLTGVEIGFQRV